MDIMSLSRLKKTKKQTNVMSRNTTKWTKTCVQAVIPTDEHLACANTLGGVQTQCE